MPRPESCVPSEGAEEEMKLIGDWLGPPPFRLEESHWEAADDIGLSDREDGDSVNVSGENLLCPGLGGSCAWGEPWSIWAPFPPFAYKVK